MGKASRDKGKRFEREWADVLRAAFPDATVTRSTQADQAHEPDVIVRGGGVADRVWWECRHADSMTAADRLVKLVQAETDANAAGREAHVPVAVTRKTGARTTVATMRLFALQQLDLYATRIAPQWRAAVVEMDADEFVSMLVKLNATRGGQ